MQPERRDATYLRDMLKYARRARDLVAGRERSEYLANYEFQYAVERVVEIIGEAASRVSVEFQQAHAEIPWRSVIGQRIILAHRYGAVLPERMWETATRAIPALIAALEPLVPTPPDEGASG